MKRWLVNLRRLSLVWGRSDLTWHLSGGLTLIPDEELALHIALGPWVLTLTLWLDPALNAYWWGTRA